jgi:hypothetical protein
MVWYNGSLLWLYETCPSLRHIWVIIYTEILFGSCCLVQRRPGAPTFPLRSALLWKVAITTVTDDGFVFCHAIEWFLVKHRDRI